MASKLPIEHLSFSALMCFMRNKYEFKRVYIDKKYRDTQTPALVVGKAFHKCMEMYYKGHSKEQSLEIGFHYIHDIEHTIDFGKTGSVEKVLEDYRQTVDHYFKDGEQFVKKEHVIASERSMKGSVEGIAVPVKAVADLVLKTPELKIVDFKKVTSLSDLNEPVKPEYLIQAAFNFWAACTELGEEPTEMLFLEVKTSKNRDKDEPQCQVVVIDFRSDTMKQYIEAVKSLTASALLLLSFAQDKLAESLFLPNVSDMLSGPESWTEWMEEQTKKA